MYICLRWSAWTQSSVAYVCKVALAVASIFCTVFNKFRVYCRQILQGKYCQLRFMRNSAYFIVDCVEYWPVALPVQVKPVGLQRAATFFPSFTRKKNRRRLRKKKNVHQLKWIFAECFHSASQPTRANAWMQVNKYNFQCVPLNAEMHSTILKSVGINGAHRHR